MYATVVYLYSIHSSPLKSFKGFKVIKTYFNIFLKGFFIADCGGPTQRHNCEFEEEGYSFQMFLQKKNNLKSLACLSNYPPALISQIKAPYV